MDQDKALKILKALAEGIDPHTGETFPPGSPYQQADIVRALYAAMAAFDSSPKQSSTKSGQSNAGKAWNPEEDARLLQAFEAGDSLDNLALQHGRTRLGIEARLAKFGKVSTPSKDLPSARFKQLREPKVHYAS
ncbi:MAG TPA: hypothetical protein VJU83_12405 [Burkholderiales bacterium]|nr:hypothetical protein [Burkholderiales bacterium]